MAKSKDNWTGRAKKMVCATCRFYVPKDGKGKKKVGRCRGRMPTMGGWPVQFPTDWCGKHKIDEDKI